MSSARVMLVVSGAAGAGTLALAVGLADGSVITLVALAVAVRASVSALVADGAPALTRQIGSSPVWLAAAVIAALRAGSTGTAEVRGAATILGPAVSHGDVVAVAASIAALLALAWTIGSGFRTAAVRDAASFADLGAVAIQILVVVALFAGPRPRGLGDIVVWVVAFVLTAAAVGAFSRARHLARLDAVAVAVSAVALVAMVAGGRA